jgi:hypothetical protein
MMKKKGKKKKRKKDLGWKGFSFMSGRIWWGGWG